MIKYLNFIELEVKNRKTKVYRVENKSSEVLGFIYFYPQWRKFVFNPIHEDIIFDANCLMSIVMELDSLTSEWRESLKSDTSIKN